MTDLSTAYKAYIKEALAKTITYNSTTSATIYIVKKGCQFIKYLTDKQQQVCNQYIAQAKYNRANISYIAYTIFLVEYKGIDLKGKGNKYNKGDQTTASYLIDASFLYTIFLKNTNNKNSSLAL